MSDAQINIIVGADTKNAQKAFNDLRASAKDVIPEGSILEARKTVERLKNEIISLSAAARNSNAGKYLSQELQGATKELDKLEKAAGLAGEATNNVFTKGFSALRQIAYILPGIGIAGILGAISEGLISLVKPLFESNTAIASQSDILKEADKDYNKAASSIFKLKEDVKLARDGFIDKNTVVKEYNETIGKTTGKVDSLDQAEQALNKNAEAYIKFTFLKAAANIAYGKAADEAFNAALAATKKQDELLSTTNKFTAFGAGNVAAPGFVPGLADKSIQTRAAFEKEVAEKNRQEQIKIATDKKDKLLAIGDDFEKQAAEIAKKSNFNFDPDGKTEKAVDSLKKNIQELGGAISDLKSLPQTIPIRAQIDKLEAEKAADELKLLLRDKIKDGLGDEAFNARLQSLQEKIRQFGHLDLHAKINTDVGSGTNNPEIDKEVKKFFEDTGKTLDERVKSLSPKKTDIMIDPNFIFTKYGESAAHYAGRIQQLTDTLNGLLANSLEKGLETIGKTLATGNLKGLFTGILEILGEGLEEFGKQLIVTGGLVKIAKVALASIFADPIAAIGVGALLIVAGSAVKSLASKQGVHAFAEGGVVTGPTLGLIGERGPEAIFPLDKLNQFMRGTTGGGAQVQGEFTVRGNDLVAVLARANKNQGLV